MHRIICRTKPYPIAFPYFIDHVCVIDHVCDCEIRFSNFKMFGWIKSKLNYLPV